MADYKVKGFHGGITDFAIGSNPDVYENAENLVINEYGDLETKPGTRYDFTTDGKRARVGNEERVGLLAPQETGVNSDFTLLKQAKDKIYFDDGTDMVELQGPAATTAFPSVVATTSFAYANWNKHTIITHEGSPWQSPVKVYRDNSGVLQLRTAGLPIGDFSATTAVNGSGANYIYAFVYKYIYNVGDTEYIDRSRPFLKEYTGIGTTTSSAAPGIDIASMDTLANGAGDHYDTATVKIEIYRSVNNGSVLYYVDEVTNGTTTYTDNDSDDTLLAEGVTLYTTGGVQANDRPPKCKYVHGTSDFVYYAHGFEVNTTDASDNELIQNRIWQSKRGDPDSVPAVFFIDIEEPITGISSIKSVPIVFGANSVYRLDGNFDVFGRGGIFPRKISDGVGCVGNLSIVQTLDGLYFAGNDGFYFTDGYRITSISAESFKDTYRLLIDNDTKKKQMYGAFDPRNKRVLWACSNDNRYPVGDNNVIFCMYVPSHTFTKWSSGYIGNGPYISENTNVNGTTVTLGNTDGISAGDNVSVSSDTTPYVVSVDSDTEVTISESFTNASYDVAFFANEPTEINYYNNFQPSSLLFDNDILWQGDGRGFTLKYDDDVLNDVLIDETIDGAAGATDLSGFDVLGHLHYYAGPILDLGSTSYRKWVNGVVIKIRPRADITAVTAVTPYGENDDNDTKQEMREIFESGFYSWGDPSISYGDPRLYMRRQTIVDVKRRFPANSLRCDYKQLHLESAFVALYNSDIYGTVAVTAGVNAVTKTVTIEGIADWPSNLFNHWISIEADAYTANLRILSRNSDTELTVLDPDGVMSVATGVKWVIRVYPANNYMNLIEYGFLYQMLGPSQGQFTANTGENA